jgi:hypothetical protein
LTLLGQEFGVRWLEPGAAGIVAAARSSITLAARSWSWQHAYRYQRGFRGNWSESGAAEVAVVPEPFRLDAAAAQAGKRALELWQRRQRMGNRGMYLRFHHAFSDWWQRFGASEPDLFALNGNGVHGPMDLSQPDRVKINVGNPDLWVKVVDKYLLQYASGHPAYAALDTTENDGGGYGVAEYCHTPESVAMDEPLPGEAFGDHLTDRYVAFANRLQTELHSRPGFADHPVGLQAYNETTSAPPRRERVQPGTKMQFVPRMADPISFTEGIYTGWKAMGAPDDWVYRPNDLNVKIGLPLGQDRRWVAMQKLGYLHGARGSDHDTCYGFWSGMSGLGYYALARQHVEPTKSFADFEAEYCAAFGAAANDVAAYYAVFRSMFEQQILPDDQASRTKRGPAFLRWGRVGGVMSRYSNYFSPTALAQAGAALTRASARQLSAPQRQRLERLQLAHRHTELSYALLQAVSDAADPLAPYRCAYELLQFRLQHRDDLTINWQVLFSHQAEMGLPVADLAAAWVELGGTGITFEARTTDGGMEQTRGDWWVSAWSSTKGGVTVPNGTWSFDDTVHAGGAASIHFHPADPNWDGVYSINKAVSVEPGATYVFSYRWKRLLSDYPSQAATLQYPGNRVRFLSAQDDLVQHQGQTAVFADANSSEMDTGWRTQQVTVRLPTDSPVRQLGLTVYIAPEGDTWIDELRLDKLVPGIDRELSIEVFDDNGPLPVDVGLQGVRDAVRAPAQWSDLKAGVDLRVLITPVPVGGG